MSPGLPSGPGRLLVAALLVGAVAGLGGGLGGAALFDAASDDPPSAQSPRGSAGIAAPGGPQGATEGAAEGAADADAAVAAARAVSPAIVTVIADGPTTAGSAQTRAVGSGVVISTAGHIVTAAHVIAGAGALAVVLPTGEVRAAQLVASDAPYTDLAVLQVDAAGLRAARWGSAAALQPGEAVLAVAGSGFAPGPAVARGVVAATGRSFPRPGVVLHDLVQTDAAVNGGDSGGALVNLRGEVVGILTTVVRQQPNGEPVVGVAFAQSAETLRPLVEAVVAGDPVPRPRLGIESPGAQHEELPPDPAAPGGARIVAVIAGSPADAAGMRAGDIVRAVNGTAVTLDRPLVNLLGALVPGTDITLTVERDGIRNDLTFPGFQE